jgi:hypothetical protein
MPFARLFGKEATDLVQPWTHASANTFSITASSMS